MDDTVFTTRFHHITDKTLELHGGERITHQRFITTGSAIGRFLFTKHTPFITVSNATIENPAIVEHCYFDGLCIALP